jgi:hypothetical protein
MIKIIRKRRKKDIKENNTMKEKKDNKKIMK